MSPSQAGDWTDGAGRAEIDPQGGGLPGARTPADRAVMARSLAYLFAAGATLALLSLLAAAAERAPLELRAG